MPLDVGGDIDGLAADEPFGKTVHLDASVPGGVAVGVAGVLQCLEPGGGWHGSEFVPAVDGRLGGGVGGPVDERVFGECLEDGGDTRDTEAVAVFVAVSAAGIDPTDRRDVGHSPLTSPNSTSGPNSSTAHATKLSVSSSRRALLIAAAVKTSPARTTEMATHPVPNRAAFTTPPHQGPRAGRFSRRHLGRSLSGE